MGSKGYQFKNAQPPSRIILLSISSHPINTVGLLVLQVYSVISSGSTLRWSCSNRWHSLSNIEDRHELSHWPLLCSTRGRCSDFWWECKIMLLWFLCFYPIINIIWRHFKSSWLESPSAHTIHYISAIVFFLSQFENWIAVSREPTLVGNFAQPDAFSTENFNWFFLPMRGKLGVTRQVGRKKKFLKQFTILAFSPSKRN